MAKKSINIRAGFDLKAFSTSSQNLTRSLQKTGAKMKSIGKSMSMSLTAPIVGLGGLAVKTFADFEQSMAKVQAISGATGKDFEALTQTAKDLGISTRFAASEVSDLMLNYSKLGFSSDEIQKITGATLDLALATGEDLATSATVAGGTLRAFGLEASQMGMVTDVMAKSFSSSALDLNKFQVSMGTIAPVAKGLGQSLQETTAQLGVLVNNGIEASTAGTMLRNMMLKATKDGFSMEEALSDIASSTDKAGTSLKYFDTRATATALVLADNIDNVKSFNAELMDAGGSAKAMADIMDNTLEGSMMKLKSATEGLGISFGEVIAPAVSAAADVLASIALKFSNLSDESKNIIVIVGSLAAAIGPLIYVVGLLSAALAVLAANPIMLTIGLLAAGFIALQIAANETNRIFGYVEKATKKMSEAYDQLGAEIAKINEIKQKGSSASLEEIKLSVLSTKATIKKTNALIKENLERKKILLAQKKEAMAQAMQATRAAGRQGEFIDVELGKVKGLEDNIALLSSEIEKLQKQGGLAVDGLTELEEQIKTLGTPSANGITKTTDALAEVGKQAEKVKINVGNIMGGGMLEKLAPKIKGIKLPEIKPIDLKVHLNKSSISETAQNLLDSVDEMAIEAKIKAQNLGEEMGAALSSGLKDLATQGLVSFGQFLGDVMSGGDMTIQDFGRGLLDSIGKFMGQFGEAMIAMGIAQTILDASIKTGNGPAAIVGGVALVAAGAALSNLSKKGIDKGGGVTDTGGGGGVNFNNQNGSPGYMMQLETKISGRDIILVQEREAAFKR